ncbi:MAG: PilN domain-containing protein [Desulfurivibrio sp.]|nr:PilN domain-containing protein [Desulfurivibrio sp.]
MEGQKAELEQQKSSYQAVQEQIEQLDEDRENLEARITAIENLQVDAELPVRILDEISNRTPTRRLWLNSLRLHEQSLEIAGIGLDNPTVAQYMRDLTSSPLLAEADLVSSAQTEVGGHRLQAFSLRIGIKPRQAVAEPEGGEEATE